MKPIWFFVGLILTTMGLIIMIVGIYGLVTDFTPSTVMADLHPSIWWGAIMLIAGLIFVIKNWKVKIE